jgi:UDP-N-acetyl-D-glucosamine/UDP-N-acetyl-D-galactosamine dehydrogenase
MNDGMGGYIANEVVKMMIKRNLTIKNANILMLGVTFKENCPDVRNTRVVDIVAELKSYDINLTVYDPWANPAEVKYEYGIDTTNDKPSGKYDAVVLAVAHDEFIDTDWKAYLNEGGIVYDVKGCLDKSLVDHRL